VVVRQQRSEGVVGAILAVLLSDEFNEQGMYETGWYHQEDQEAA